MKKTLLIAAAALAAGMLSVQAQSNVYSQNIVGYVNKVLPAGYSQVAIPVGGSNTVETAIPAIQPGDNVFIWTGGGYDVRSYLGVNWDGNGHSWADENFNGVASPVLSPGQAVFYQNGQGVNQTNTFVGSVVLSNTVTLHAGYSMIASTAPIAAKLDSASFSLPLQPGDNVFIWNGGGYTTLSYLGVDWDGNGHSWADENFNGVDSPIVQPGQGFYYQNGQGSDEIWHQNVIVN